VTLKEQLINTFTLCVSNNCLEDICLPAFVVIDEQPCRLLTDDQSGFRIKNPRKHLLHFFKIDWCVLFERDGKKCDFAVFNADELIFVELKKIEANTSYNHKKHNAKRKDAYDQLENTLEIFQSKNIDLSSYQKNQKLFVIASVLKDDNAEMPTAKTNNQHKNIEFEIKYNAILLTGNTHKFT